MVLYQRRWLAEGDAGGGDADAGGKGGSDTGDDDTSGKSGGDKKFTQADMDQHASAAVKKRIDRVNAKYAGVDEKLERLAELETAAKDQGVADDVAKGEYASALERLKKGHTSEVEKLTGDRDTWKDSYNKLAIDKALISAAAAGNAVEPDQVAALLRGKVELDAELTPRFDDGKDIATGVKAWLEANPHFVSSTARGGSGTGDQTRGQHGQQGAGGDGFSGMTAEQIKNLTPEEVQAKIRRVNQGPFARAESK